MDIGLNYCDVYRGGSGGRDYGADGGGDDGGRSCVSLCGRDGEDNGDRSGLIVVVVS